MQGKEMEIITTLGDYKKIGKLMFPFLMEISGGMPQKMIFEKIVVNQPIDNALFAKPAVKK